MPVREQSLGSPLPSGHWKQPDMQTENVAFGFWLEFKSVHSGTSANVSGRPIPLKTLKEEPLCLPSSFWHSRDHLGKVDQLPAEGR